MKKARLKIASIGLSDDPLQASATGFYSPDYFTARRRFVSMCERLGAENHMLGVDAPSPNADPLAMDVAVIGSSTPKSALVISGGVHGVEGFFGSAVQLAYIERLGSSWRPPPDGALVLIHAVNPFGFAWRRRFNEDNVDLNRNFLLADQAYVGAPPLCGTFRSALMPRRRRLRFIANWTFARLALRHGLRSFWETLPVGQYEYDDWLFYGGRSQAQSAKLLELSLPPVLSSCEEIVHLDFHTGLGEWANCQLLLPGQDSAENIGWWKRHFGVRDAPAAMETPAAYEIRGGFGPWVQGLFPHARYRFVTAEFGTYSAMRVIQSLLDEHQWHSKLGTQSPEHWSRRRLADTFVPRNARWRTTTLATGVALIDRAADILWS